MSSNLPGTNPGPHRLKLTLTNDNKTFNDARNNHNKNNDARNNHYKKNNNDKNGFDTSKNSQEKAKDLQDIIESMNKLALNSDGTVNSNGIGNLRLEALPKLPTYQTLLEQFKKSITLFTLASYIDLDDEYYYKIYSRIDDVYNGFITLLAQFSHLHSIDTVQTAYPLKPPAFAKRTDQFGLPNPGNKFIQDEYARFNVILKSFEIFIADIVELSRALCPKFYRQLAEIYDTNGSDLLYSVATELKDKAGIARTTMAQKKTVVKKKKTNNTKFSLEEFQSNPTATINKATGQDDKPSNTPTYSSVVYHQLDSFCGVLETFVSSIDLIHLAPVYSFNLLHELFFQGRIAFRVEVPNNNKNDGINDGEDYANIFSPAYPGSPDPNISANAPIAGPDSDLVEMTDSVDLLEKYFQQFEIGNDNNGDPFAANNHNNIVNKRMDNVDEIERYYSTFNYSSPNALQQHRTQPVTKATQSTLVTIMNKCRKANGTIYKKPLENKINIKMLSILRKLPTLLQAKKARGIISSSTGSGKTIIFPLIACISSSIDVVRTYGTLFNMYQNYLRQNGTATDGVGSNKSPTALFPVLRPAYRGEHESYFNLLYKPLVVLVLPSAAIVSEKEAFFQRQHASFSRNIISSIGRKNVLNRYMMSDNLHGSNVTKPTLILTTPQELLPALTKMLQIKQDVLNNCRIILDEAHERTAYLDCLLAYCSHYQSIIYQNNTITDIFRRFSQGHRPISPNIPQQALAFSIMSATIDQDTSNILDPNNTDSIYLDPQLLYEVKKERIEVKLLAQVQTAVVQATVSVCNAMFNPDEGVVDENAPNERPVDVSTPPGHILMFLPGLGECEKALDEVCKSLTQIEPRGLEDDNVKYVVLQTMLDDECNNLDEFYTELSNEVFAVRTEIMKAHDPNKPKLHIVPIFPITLSGKVRALQKDIAREPFDTSFYPDLENVYKLIAATNAVESSVTFEGLTGMIDSGVHKQSVFDVENGVATLNTLPIPEDSRTQRLGRVGRVSPGQAVQIIFISEKNGTKTAHNIPDMLSSEPGQLFLELRRIGISLEKINPTLPTPLEQNTINTTLETLVDFGLINRGDGNLTPKGQDVVKFSMFSPFYATLIYNAMKHNPALGYLTAVIVVTITKFARGACNYSEHIPKLFDIIFDPHSELCSTVSLFLMALLNRKELQKFGVIQCGIDEASWKGASQTILEVFRQIYDLENGTTGRQFNQNQTIEPFSLSIFHRKLSFAFDSLGPKRFNLEGDGILALQFSQCPPRTASLYATLCSVLPHQRALRWLVGSVLGNMSALLKTFRTKRLFQLTSIVSRIDSSLSYQYKRVSAIEAEEANRARNAYKGTHNVQVDQANGNVVAFCDIVATVYESAFGDVASSYPPHAYLLQEDVNNTLSPPRVTCGLFHSADDQLLQSDWEYISQLINHHQIVPVSTAITSAPTTLRTVQIDAGIMSSPFSEILLHVLLGPPAVSFTRGGGHSRTQTTSKDQRAFVIDKPTPKDLQAIFREKKLLLRGATSNKVKSKKMGHKGRGNYSDSDDDDDDNDDLFADNDVQKLEKERPSVTLTISSTKTDAEIGNILLQMSDLLPHFGHDFILRQNDTWSQHIKFTSGANNGAISPSVHALCCHDGPLYSHLVKYQYLKGFKRRPNPIPTVQDILNDMNNKLFLKNNSFGPNVENDDDPVQPNNENNKSNYQSTTLRHPHIYRFNNETLQFFQSCILNNDLKTLVPVIICNSDRFFTEQSSTIANSNDSVVVKIEHSISTTIHPHHPFCQTVYPVDKDKKIDKNKPTPSASTPSFTIAFLSSGTLAPINSLKAHLLSWLPHIHDVDITLDQHGGVVTDNPGQGKNIEAEDPLQAFIAGLQHPTLDEQVVIDAKQQAVFSYMVPNFAIGPTPFDKKNSRHLLDVKAIGQIDNFFSNAATDPMKSSYLQTSFYKIQPGFHQTVFPKPKEVLQQLPRTDNHGDRVSLGQYNQTQFYLILPSPQQLPTFNCNVQNWNPKTKQTQVVDQISINAESCPNAVRVTFENIKLMASLKKKTFGEMRKDELDDAVRLGDEFKQLVESILPSDGFSIICKTHRSLKIQGENEVSAIRAYTIDFLNYNVAKFVITEFSKRCPHDISLRNNRYNTMVQKARGAIDKLSSNPLSLPPSQLKSLDIQLHYTPELIIDEDNPPDEDVPESAIYRRSLVLQAKSIREMFEKRELFATPRRLDIGTRVVNEGDNINNFGAQIRALSTTEETRMLIHKIQNSNYTLPTTPILIGLSNCPLVLVAKDTVDFEQVISACGLNVYNKSTIHPTTTTTATTTTAAATTTSTTTTPPQTNSQGFKGLMSFWGVKQEEPQQKEYRTFGGVKQQEPQQKEYRMFGGVKQQEPQQKKCRMFSVVDSFEKFMSLCDENPLVLKVTSSIFMTTATAIDSLDCKVQQDLPPCSFSKQPAKFLNHDNIVTTLANSLCIDVVDISAPSYISDTFALYFIRHPAKHLGKMSSLIDKEFGINLPQYCSMHPLAQSDKQQNCDKNLSFYIGAETNALYYSQAINSGPYTPSITCLDFDFIHNIPFASTSSSFPSLFHLSSRLLNRNEQNINTVQNYPTRFIHATVPKIEFRSKLIYLSPEERDEYFANPNDDNKENKRNEKTPLGSFLHRHKIKRPDIKLLPSSPREPFIIQTRAIRKAASQNDGAKSDSSIDMFLQSVAENPSTPRPIQQIITRQSIDKGIDEKVIWITEPLSWLHIIIQHDYSRGYYLQTHPELYQDRRSYINNLEYGLGVLLSRQKSQSALHHCPDNIVNMMNSYIKQGIIPATMITINVPSVMGDPTTLHLIVCEKQYTRTLTKKLQKCSEWRQQRPEPTGLDPQLLGKYARLEQYQRLMQFNLNNNFTDLNQVIAGTGNQLSNQMTNLAQFYYQSESWYRLSHAYKVNPLASKEIIETYGTGDEEPPVMMCMLGCPIYAQNFPYYSRTDRPVFPTTLSNQTANIHINGGRGVFENLHYGTTTTNFCMNCFNDSLLTALDSKIKKSDSNSTIEINSGGSIDPTMNPWLSLKTANDQGQGDDGIAYHSHFSIGTIILGVLNRITTSLQTLRERASIIRQKSTNGISNNNSANTDAAKTAQFSKMSILTQLYIRQINDDLYSTLIGQNDNLFQRCPHHNDFVAVPGGGSCQSCAPSDSDSDDDKCRFRFCGSSTCELFHAGECTYDPRQVFVNKITDLLSLKTPCCSRAYFFDGCNAVTCECGTAFCGLCHEMCGRDAHAHLKSCRANKGTNYDYFSRAEYRFDANKNFIIIPELQRVFDRDIPSEYHYDVLEMVRASLKRSDYAFTEQEINHFAQTSLRGTGGRTNLYQIRQYIDQIHDIFSLKTPCCQRIYEFTGCNAVYCDCRGDGLQTRITFCGLCHALCGTNSHPHVKNDCVYNNTNPGRDYYSTVEFRLQQNKVAIIIPLLRSLFASQPIDHSSHALVDAIVQELITSPYQFTHDEANSLIAGR